MAIQRFKDKEAQQIFEGYFSRKIPQRIQSKARTRLIQLDSAATLNDLRLPPSNQLESLAGTRKGQHSIRINTQYRICFNWNDGSVTDVEITDYH